MILNDVDDLEYGKLIKRLEFFDSMRNTLLTFSFTAVLAVLGIAIKDEMNSVNPWMCLVPYFLIIPFAARISYYRLASAHINSFLKILAKEKMQFELGTNVVNEGNGKRYRLIAWLINHEMVLLGAASSWTFYFKYVPGIEVKTAGSYFALIFAGLLVIFTYIISDYTYDYKKMMESYSKEWNQYFDKADITTLE